MKNLKTMILCAGLLLGTVSNIAYAAGSYVSSASGETIYSPNVWYQTNFDVLGNPPSTSKITNVSWKYASRSMPSGGTWVANLCHGTTSSCINVSSLSSGSSTFFNNKSAATKFFLVYGIQSGSNFTPVSSGTDQVIVYW